MSYAASPFANNPNGACFMNRAGVADRPVSAGQNQVWGIEVTRSTNARVVAGLAIWMLAGCNLVLGIDEVSSANGPDSGQQISSATADPEAGVPGHAHDAANADNTDDAGKPL